MSLALLFHYLMLNMFRMLIHPSSGACDLFVELFNGLYCSGSNQSNTTHDITQQISRKLQRMDMWEHPHNHFPTRRYTSQ